MYKALNNGPLHSQFSNFHADLRQLISGRYVYAGLNAPLTNFGDSIINYEHPVTPLKSPAT